MATQQQTSGRLCSYFEAGQMSKPSSFQDRFELYKLIQSGAFQQATDYILNTHREGILDGFQTIPKGQYQADKKRLLPLACFHGAVDRSADLPADFKHSGVLTLDLDGNGKEKQGALWSLIQSGRLVYVEAAGFSVSGPLTKDLWANVRIEIPAPGQKVSRRLKQLLKLSADHSYIELVTALHDAYFRAFARLFKKQLDFDLTTKSDLKRTRYLAAAKDLYLAPEGKTYGLAPLEVALEELEKAKAEVQGFDSTAVNIEAGDAFQFAEQFAQIKYQYIDGQRTHYVNRIAIACNLLGVQQADVTAYIQQTYRYFDVYPKKDVVSYPYRKYRESFGLWSSRLRTPEAPADDVFDLAPGQRLSDLTDQLAALINEKRFIDLKAGTGSGKSYAAALTLPAKLKALNGCKTVIICSLNAKAEKDGQQYGLPVITGEALKRAGMGAADLKKQAWKSDAILTSQNYFLNIAKRAFSRGEKLNVIIDESHSLISGFGYRSEAVAGLWNACKHVAQTVTLMTGTPKPYFRQLGFFRIEVRADRLPIHCIVRNRQTGDLALTALLHCRQTDFSTKRLVIKIQSKAQLKATKALLIQEGFKSEEVVVLYAEKSVKETDAFQQFLQAGAGQESFADKVKVVLTTSVVGEGLDVYGDKYELQFVNIEKASSFDVEALIQFADRWRTNKEKTLVTYHLESDKDRPHFDALTEFDQARALWQQEADRLNTTKERLAAYSTKTALLSLRTQYSAADSFLTTDETTGAFAVNDLRLAAFVDQQRTRSMTTDKGLEVIKSAFPYFHVDDQRNSAAGEAVTDIDLTDLKSALLIEKEDAQATLQTLWKQDKDALLQAIGARTDDAKLKSRITFSADLKARAGAIVDANSAIFTDHLQEAERLAKRYFSTIDLLLEDDNFDRIAFKEKEGRQVFVSAERFAAFNTELKLHLLLFIFGLVKDCKKKFNSRLQILTALQGVDAKLFLKVVADLEAAGAKGRLTNKELLKVVAGSYRAAGVKRFDHSTRSAVGLASTFFQLRRITGKEAAYEIGDRIDLPAFLRSHKIDVQKYAGKLSERFNFKES